MSKKCDLTNKTALTGNNRSHALNSTKRKFNLNLVTIKTKDANGRPVKIKATARAARTLRKQNLN